MIRHEIERHLVQPQEMEIVLYLDPMLYWFNGHFAVQPLLPGVAQLDWVMHYATTLLAPGWRFRSIQNVKFLAPLIPETTDCYPAINMAGNKSGTHFLLSASRR